MERRGFLTWAAIGLVGAVALLALGDALRDVGLSTSSPAPTQAVATTTAASSTTTPRPEPQADAPAGWRTGRLDGVLTFIDANDCTIRAIGLASGRERPLAPFETACGELWAPPVGSLMAFVQPFEDGGMMRIVNLDRGGDDLGTYVGSGDVHWSPDGQRAVWCTDRRLGRGVERQSSGKTRAIPVCPVGYTLDGELAHIAGRRLVVGGRTVARTRYPINSAYFGRGGAVVTVDVRGNVRRWGAGSFHTRSIAGWSGLPPTFSPDLCFALFPRTLGFTEVDLGCDGRVSFHRLPGTSAAWSPDGRWLAVAVPGAIWFYPAGSTEPSEHVWPARALALAWRP